MIRAPRENPPEHPVEGHMANTEPGDLFDFFTRRPPTDEQSDVLAAEELSGRAREEMFVLLDYFRGRS